jgi:hypothetical protein
MVEGSAGPECAAITRTIIPGHGGVNDAADAMRFIVM